MKITSSCTGNIREPNIITFINYNLLDICATLWNSKSVASHKCQHDKSETSGEKVYKSVFN